MDERLLLVIYCALILVASMAGGLIPLVIRLTHTRLQLATSFVAGFMLGIGLLHLLPHAEEELHSPKQTALALLLGFVVMFFIQRFFHFHHHDVPDEAPEHDPAHDHSHHDHDHHAHDESLAAKSASNLSWTGAALGLTLHTLIDGIAVAASVEAESHLTHAATTLLGFGTFLVVILHKPFDAMAVGTLMAASGRSRSTRHLANALFALAFPVGVLLFHLGISSYSGLDEQFVGFALAFTAGTFVCIAASDLLPELQFHSHDRIKLSVALLLGLGFSALIGQVESSNHEHPSPTGVQHSHPHPH